MRKSLQGNTVARRQKGFTIIELLLVVVIVAILVAMAVPAYLDYTIRSKISECVNNAAVPKVTISEYRQALGAFPPSAVEAGLINTGDTEFCNGFTAYSASDGSFLIEVDEIAIDNSLGDISPRLIPSVTAGNFIMWNCSVGTTAASNLRYLPATCRDPDAPII